MHQLLFAAHVVFFRLDKYSLVSAADEVDKLSVLCAEDHLGLGLSRLNAQFADVEAAAAPPVGPADDGVLLPAHLHHQQVSDVFVSGDEEGQSAVGVQGR